MNRQNHYCYEDDKLTGLEIAVQIIACWETGQYRNIAEVTTAVHRIRQELPRSVIFWLAFHTLESATSSPETGEQSTIAWPRR